MGNLVGKAIKVTWRDHTSLSVDGVNAMTLTDADWNSAIPTLAAFGKVMFENEKFLVIHPFPILEGSMTESLLNKVMVFSKLPLECIETLEPIKVKGAIKREQTKKSKNAKKS